MRRFSEQAERELTFDAASAHLEADALTAAINEDVCLASWREHDVADLLNRVSGLVFVLGLSKRVLKQVLDIR
jgi:hypothetical protein